VCRNPDAARSGSAVDELTGNRPLDPVYPVIFIDAIHVKTRGGEVVNRPIYVALAVTGAGRRDILGLWAMTRPRAGREVPAARTRRDQHRGVNEVLMIVCGGQTTSTPRSRRRWPTRT